MICFRLKNNPTLIQKEKNNKECTNLCFMRFLNYREAFTTFLSPNIIQFSLRLIFDLKLQLVYTKTAMDIYILIGILYLVIGTAGFCTNFSVIFIKLKFRKHFFNVTYVFMIQQAIGDNIMLSAIAIFGAILLFLPNLKHVEAVVRFFGFCGAVGWCSSSMFLCLVAFSRFISIARSDQFCRRIFPGDP